MKSLRMGSDFTSTFSFSYCLRALLSLVYFLGGIIQILNLIIHNLTNEVSGLKFCLKNLAEENERLLNKLFDLDSELVVR